MSENPNLPDQEAPDTQDIPPLSTDVEVLADEWNALNYRLNTLSTQLLQSRQVVKDTEAQIRHLENSGLQLVGQIGMLTRILVGKGVDPKKFGPTAEQLPEEIGTEIPQKEAEVVEIQRDIPQKGPRSRFSKS